MSTAIIPFAGTYEIDRTHSSVQFAVKHIVSTFRASFDEIEGRLVGGDTGTTLTASARVESVSIVDPASRRYPHTTPTSTAGSPSRPSPGYGARSRQPTRS